MPELVQCRLTTCLAYSFCSHAVAHIERKNCYNHEAEKRTTEYGRQYIVCPECQPVEVKNNGS